MENKARIHAITESIKKSNYSISAVGWRNVSITELTQIADILVNAKPDEMLSKLNELYKYNPDTIELDKYMQKSNCDRYIEGTCKCYHPDHKGECWYVEAREKDYQRFRSSAQYTTWRTDVFERDNYTCQHCGQKGGTLNAHHKKSYADYPSLRVKLSNGITLCEECHKAEHRRLKEGE